MSPVARELSAHCGVLEPLQTATSVEGQIDELHAVLKKHANVPLTLIGFSWGAWLSFLLAARHPESVRKLILVGGGPFEEKYVAGIEETRFSRLSKRDRAEAETLQHIWKSGAAPGRGAALARLGELFSQADAYDWLSSEPDEMDFHAEIFESVWPEAAALRKSGMLLEAGRKIACPVVAIHGDSDPHPAEGVREPLSHVLRDFQFILLERCGHKPWVERHARIEFFRILNDEIHSK
ncbi:MAG: alpha/beta hydrolase [Acidobacteria bacterium]|nr:alpha/beta hydrolase [Acidobacteriota bacterium]